jgi:hypothetical protein
MNSFPVELDVDPRTLHVSPQRPTGADPAKLQRQIARFGTSTVGMPPILVYCDLDDRLIIWDGMTRATRVAKLLPGTLVRVIVLGRLNARLSALPIIADVLP